MASKPPAGNRTGKQGAAAERPARARSGDKKYKVEHVVVPLKRGGQPKKG